MSRPLPTIARPLVAGAATLIDLQATLSALRDGSSDIHIPAGHPLADTNLRAFFIEAFEKVDVVECEWGAPAQPVRDDDLVLHISRHAPICSFAAGLIGGALAVARARLNEMPKSSLTDRLGVLCDTEFRDALISSVTQKVQQTVALEYNVARLDTPELSFECFCSGLLERDAQDRILAEYPKLAHRLGHYCQQQAVVFARFADRLIRDWQAVNARLGLSGSLPSSLSFGEGDVHNGGQSVVILTCDDGGKLVYKPRDISVEIAFDGLLGHFNEVFGETLFWRVKSLERDGYGWVEYVTAEPCRSTDEVETFYHRVGALLAVLHLLGGFDLHQENLIAHGSHPVVVDLETLFFSFKNGSFLGRDDPFLSAAEYPAVKALLGSVMSTLMLPQHARNENVSAIAGGEAVARFANRFDPDRNRMVQYEDGTTEFLNRPVLNGALVEPHAYADLVAAGFSRLYDHMMHARADYAAPDGPVGEVADHLTRVVVRDTQIYTDLLDRSWHPALLGDGHDLAVHFLQIWRPASATPSTIPLMFYEIAELISGDVPYFTQQPKACEVRAGHMQLVEGYHLDRSGFEAFQDRLAQMSEADRDLQCWIIRGSLDSGLREGKGSYERSDRSEVTAEEERRALDHVHTMVMSMAQRGIGLLDWLTVTPTPDERLMLAPVDVTLYNGISGLTLYLAYHAEVTGTDRVHAEQAFANLERQIDDDWGNFAIPGAMSGLAGAAYVMVHLAVLWDRPDLFDRAFELLKHDADLIMQDDGLFDVTVGAAGVLCVLCAAAESSGQARFTGLARRMGERLIDMARHDERGAYWVAQEDERPLTGLSHGFSGIILAMARLNDIDPDNRWGAVAHAAMLRENADFVPSAQNWIDWRYANLDPDTWDDPSNFQYFWCNGGAGIALARLAMQTETADDRVTDDLKAAAAGTLAGGIGHNHSLCHGDLGNADILAQIARALKDPALKDQAERVYARAVHTILDGHVFGGASRLATPPDLMTGLSGVGWGILRHMAPERVPDVMTLSPPRRRLS
ncbi:type 2 lanthipeptide synthetase LanM family protein [Shimia ponticola]|uniref:type 2 lanthipeptide synthetase LanM family protein n=1 Tax=Shimia ponticola TaxID=2582893 RepID=UPI0011BE3A15|nr:type 2 lanthipeptide synthetase LanM family protein [Shimia ponticola]